MGLSSHWKKTSVVEFIADVQLAAHPKPYVADHVGRAVDGECGVLIEAV
jgi:hypothetical protein